MKQHLQSGAGFVVFLLMCLGAQLTGSLLTFPAIRSGWYAGLEKPFFNPHPMSTNHVAYMKLGHFIICKVFNFIIVFT